MRMQADNMHKLSGSEYDDSYTAHWVSEVTEEDTLVTVRKITVLNVNVRRWQNFYFVLTK